MIYIWRITWADGYYVKEYRSGCTSLTSAFYEANGRGANDSNIISIERIPQDLTTL